MSEGKRLPLCEGDHNWMSWDCNFNRAIGKIEGEPWTKELCKKCGVTRIRKVPCPECLTNTPSK